MKKIKLFVDTGWAGCDHEEIVEVNDNITEEELDEMAEDFRSECISYGWCEVEEGEDN